MGLSWFTLWPPLARVLFILACLTIILTGLYLAAPLINQVLLAMLLAIMLDPPDYPSGKQTHTAHRLVTAGDYADAVDHGGHYPQVNRADARFDATQPSGARAAGGTA
jgi:hypothetical protein